MGTSAPIRETRGGRVQRRWTKERQGGFELSAYVEILENGQVNENCGLQQRKVSPFTQGSRQATQANPRLTRYSIYKVLPSHGCLASQDHFHTLITQLLNFLHISLFMVLLLRYLLAMIYTSISGCWSLSYCRSFESSEETIFSLVVCRTGVPSSRLHHPKTESRQ